MTGVLYVLKRLPRASETVVLREMLRLEAAGVEVGVDALLRSADQPRPIELHELRGRVRYVSNRGDVAARVAGRAMAEGYDRLHAHFATAAAEVAVAAGRLSGLPVTVTAHATDIFHRDHAPTLSRRLAGAESVITGSQYNATHLRSVLLGTPVHVVLNAVDPQPRRRRVTDGPVLCVARLVPKKGVHTLVQAVGLLAGVGVRVEVEIVGDGPERHRLEGFARHLRVADRVHFLGALTGPEVEAAYERASCFALPCRVDENGDRDALPTAIGEAMVRSLPVISTSIVGIPELVEHARTGLLVPPNDPAALAGAIDRIRLNPAEADRFGAAGRREARAMLSPAVATTALLQVWHTRRGAVA